MQKNYFKIDKQLTLPCGIIAILIPFKVNCEFPGSHWHNLYWVAASTKPITPRGPLCLCPLSEVLLLCSAMQPPKQHTKNVVN